MEWASPWDLRQRGMKDAKRHRERVREAIRKNLHHLIVEEAIITSRGDRKVKVPIKYLTHYHFRYGDNWEGVGRGPGEPGDIIGRKSKPGDHPGQMDGAGDQPGDLIYEQEVSFDELTEIMLEDLNLPRLKDNEKKEVEAEGIRFDDVRRRGLIHNLDKRRSLLENVKRRASRGQSGVGRFDDRDLRYRVWTDVKKPTSRAAIYMLMDRSGSMSSEKRYIAKSFFFWLTRFLKLKYDQVELIFIAHDVRAEIVSEEDFFTVSASGGTRCSSAYHLAKQHLKEMHPPLSWNNYIFHFTDGDNLPSDNDEATELLTSLLKLCRMVGYGEITYRNFGAFYRPSATSGAAVGTERRLSSLYKALSTIESDHLILTSIDSRDEIYRTLQDFLAGDGRGAS